MDTYTLVFLVICGLICVVGLGLLFLAVFRRRKLDKQWLQILKHHRFNLVRAIVMQHSDPQWREEWLQKIAQAEQGE